MPKKFKFRKLGGVHNHYNKKTGKRTTYFKGDTIEVDSPEDLGSAICAWKLIGRKKIKAEETKTKKTKPKKSKKRSKIKTEEHTLAKPPELPEKAADGVKTKGFVRDIDLKVNDILRPTWIDPKSSKVYWMDDGGYLSPINPEDPDDPPRDGSGNIIGSIASDDPVSGLQAIHMGSGWYDVVNAKTGEQINDKRLRKKEAEALVDGKIVDSS